MSKYNIQSLLYCKLGMDKIYPHRVSATGIKTKISAFNINFQINYMLWVRTAILFVLATLASALHVKLHDTSQAYVSTLKSQQAGITDQVSAIKASISKAQNILAQQSDPAKKIQILEQAILEQKGLLNQLTLSANTALNESSWTCQKYSSTSRDQLAGLIAQVVNSTKQIDSTISTINNQSIVTQYRPDTSAAVSTAEALQRSIYSNGTQVDQLTTNKQTNWLAPNWVTGSKSLADVEREAQDTEAKYGFVEACPLSTPYFDGTQCIGCPQTARYFNLETKKCMDCSNYNPNTRNCPSGTPPIVNPPQNTTTNTTTTPNKTNFATGQNRLILPPNTSLSTLTQQPGTQCPADRPFYTPSGCIDCTAPNSLFNISTKQCATCEAGTSYVPSKGVCVATVQVPVTNLPVASNRLILPQGTTVADLQKKQETLAGSQNVVVCPADKPFSNDKQCLDCPTEQYYNVGTLLCESCAQGTAYNQATRSCTKVTFYSNLTNPNWTSTNPEATRQTVLESSKNPGAVACPEGKSFFDGYNCVGCPSGQYFTFDGTRCESCVGGTVFSVNQHSCVKSQAGLYQTAVATAPNLIFDGTSKGEWVSIYKQNQQQNPQIKDCPTDRPYFDAIRCINCPKNLPYFNLRYKQCQICETGSKYDDSVHECLSESGDIISQRPNIEKMVASIFT